MGRFEELLLIFAIGLLLFGPNKLTDLAKALGSSLNEFKKAANPEGNQPAPATAQPVYVQAAHTPARRRRRAPVAKKKAKASR
jgi:TatA/E family protein of Tat protein translocase